MASISNFGLKIYYLKLRMKTVSQNVTILYHVIYTKEVYKRKKLANIEDDDIDLSLVIEQLWEDLELARKQISYTTERSDFYAEQYNLDKWDGKFNG